jgi:hypothetical protein
MPTSDERLKILKMLQDGKITAEDAMQLLEAMSRQAPQEKTAFSAAATGMTAQWMRVQITDSASDKIKANVRLPFSLVNTGMKMGAHFSANLSPEVIKELNLRLKTGETGMILDVVDNKQGDRIRIFLE